MELLVSKIKESLQLNHEFINLMTFREVNFKKMLIISKKSQKIDKEIRRVYKKTHLKSRNCECFHLAPYMHFLLHKKNYFKSAFNVYKIYTQRIQSLFEIMRDQDDLISQQNFLSNSVIFLVDSRKSHLGLIKDVYGDLNYMELERESTLGISMDALVPEKLVESHRAMVEDYINDPL